MLTNSHSLNVEPPRICRPTLRAPQPGWTPTSTDGDARWRPLGAAGPGTDCRRCKRLRRRRLATSGAAAASAPWRCRALIRCDKPTQPAQSSFELCWVFRCPRIACAPPFFNLTGALTWQPRGAEDDATPAAARRTQAVAESPEDMEDASLAAQPAHAQKLAHGRNRCGSAIDMPVSTITVRH